MKRTGLFIWTKLNPLYQKMLCAKLGWNWPTGSSEDDFKFVNVFSLFRNDLPLEKGVIIHLNKLVTPTHFRMLCAKFGWNWPSGSGEEDITWKVYDNYNINDDGKRTNFDQKSSLEPLAQVSSKGVALHLNNIEIALRKDSLRQVRLKFA